jgi:hypothetical protein
MFLMLDKSSRVSGQRLGDVYYLINIELSNKLGQDNEPGLSFGQWNASASVIIHLPLLGSAFGKGQPLRCCFNLRVHRQLCFSTLRYEFGSEIVLVSLLMAKRRSVNFLSLSVNWKVEDLSSLSRLTLFTSGTSRSASG